MRSYSTKVEIGEAFIPWMVHWAQKLVNKDDLMRIWTDHPPIHSETHENSGKIGMMKVISHLIRWLRSKGPPGEHCICCMKEHLFFLL